MYRTFLWISEFQRCLDLRKTQRPFVLCCSKPISIIQSFVPSVSSRNTYVLLQQDQLSFYCMMLTASVPCSASSAWTDHHCALGVPFLPHTATTTASKEFAVHWSNLRTYMRYGERERGGKRVCASELVSEWTNKRMKEYKHNVIPKDFLCPSHLSETSSFW